MNVGRSARPIAKRMHRALQALDAASSPQTERSQQSVQVLRDERDERLARNSCKAAAFNSQGCGAPTPAGRPWKTCPNNPFQALKGETKVRAANDRPPRASGGQGFDGKTCRR